jgi:hypothetical protein
MILQIDRSRFWTFLHRMGCRGVIQFEVVVHFDSVMQDRHAGVFDLLAGIVISGRCVVDVVSLPGQRREAHIHGRIADRINAATLVVFSFQAERIENLSSYRPCM